MNLSKKVNKFYYKKKTLVFLSISQFALYLLLINDAIYGFNRYIISNDEIYKYIPNNGLYKITKNDSNYSQIKINALPLWMEPITSDDSIIFFCYFNGIMYKGLGLYYTKSREIEIINLNKLGLPSNYFNDIRLENNQLFIQTITGIYYTDLPVKKTNRFSKLEGFPNLRSIQVVKNDIISLTDSSLNKYTFSGNTYHLINSTATNKADYFIVNYSKKNIYVFDEEKNIKTYEYRNLKLLNTLKIPKVLNDLHNNCKLSFINGNLYIIQNDNVFVFDGISFNKVLDFSVSDIQKTNTKLYIISSKGLIKLIDLSKPEKTKPLKITYDDNKIKLSAAEINKNECFVSWSTSGNYWHNYIPIKNFEIPIDSVQKGTIQIKVLDNNLILHKVSVTNRVFWLNTIKKITIYLMVILILSINWYVILLKKYEHLYILLLPILLITFIVIVKYGFGLFVTKEIYVLIITEITTITVGILIDFFKRNRTEEECLTKIHSFNHGSLGFNNILHLKRLCESKSEYNQVNKQSFVTSLQSAIEDYQKLSYPLLINLIKEFPIKAIWLKELVSVAVYAIKLNKMVSKFDIGKEKEMCITNKNLYTTLKKLRQKVYLFYAIAPEVIVKEMVDYYISKYPDIKFSFTIFGNSAKVLFKKDELKKTLGNLIDNAVESLILKNEKKNTIKPEIEISINTNTFYTNISIKDNGIQLPNINLKRLFTLSYSNKTNGGFGLYEAKKTINKYLGDIEVEQNELQQKIFTIKLKSVYA